MEVNHKWKLGSDICPLCNKQKEDWLHTLQCTAPVQISHRDLCLADLELKLKQYKTYPPLADFIYETVANQNLEPENPNIINPRYMNAFEKAYQSQINVGWDNFLRGIPLQWAPSFRYLTEAKIDPPNSILWKSALQIFFLVGKHAHCIVKGGFISWLKGGDDARSYKRISVLKVKPDYLSWRWRLRRARLYGHWSTCSVFSRSSLQNGHALFFHFK